MIRKIAGRKRIFLLAAVGSLLFILSILSYLYFGEEQIQRRIKERICNKVIAHEDELSEIVKEVPLEEGLSYFKGTNTDSSIQWVYYKELDDERIDKVFKDLHLAHIYKYKYLDESIEFVVKPTVISALWNGYRCGFYYTENDDPINVVWTDDYQEGAFYFYKIGEIGKEFGTMLEDNEEYSHWYNHSNFEG